MTTASNTPNLPQSAADSIDSSGEVSSRTMWLFGGSLLIAIIWLFWDFLYRQVLFAINQQADWGHTLVIPFIAGYFVWLNRAALLREPFRASWTGLVLLLAGMTWYSFCALGPVVLRHHNLMGAGVGLTLIGLTLFLFGWRSMRWLWFPLLYMIIFSQTISNRFLEILTFNLQDIAAYGSYWGLTIFGYDVSKSGNALRIFHQGETIPINIAEACSGMRMVVALLALGIAMAYRGLDHVWQRLALVLFAIPTALFVNILRVMTLGILATYDSGFAGGDFHSMIGLLWLLPAFFIYLGIMWILRNLIQTEDSDDEEESTGQSESLRVRFSRQSRVAFVVSCLALVLGGIGLQAGASALNVYLRKDPVHLRRSLANLPATVGDWRMVHDIRIPEAAVEELGTSIYLSRIYSDTTSGSTPSLSLHVAFYTGQIDVVPHVPDRCMVAGGLMERHPEPKQFPLDIDQSEWSIDPEHTLAGQAFRMASTRNWLTGEEEMVRLPVGDLVIRTSEFFDPSNDQERIFAGYFFIANGRLTPNPGGVRLLAFNPTEQYAYYCKVQLTAQGGHDFDADRFLELASDLLNELLPEIMRCLPDWAEVQSGDMQETT
ncbi:MAG: exosortase/archaeosortase family protein [Phycisphaerales bacterium]|nr:exosortase/archaeosortase family protein [Phycisphaerales bacterium]